MKRPSVALIENSGVTHETHQGYYPLHLQRGYSPILTSVVSEVKTKIAHMKNRGEGELTSEGVIQLVYDSARQLGFELSSCERDEVLIQLENEEKPFGVLQDLIEDERVSDVIVSSYNKITVQQGRRNFKTDISFQNQDMYESFVERLLIKAGTSYSTKKPIADGMIGGVARLHAVHKVLAEGGPYITIRLNRFSSVTIQDLVKAGLAPEPVLAYLRALVDTGQTLLIAGEVGTGKTTLARALGNTIPLDESILVIEDTPEIKLEHPHVRYVTTREANTDGAGKVSPAECIRGGMRMAMNRIIFGEIRDAEAAESFIDVCASGHPGLSTIHGRTSSESVSRLELFLGRAQRGVEDRILKEQVANAVQCVVHVGICKKTDKRRILEVREIGPVADNVLRHREIFKYAYTNESPTWKISTRASAHRDHIEKTDSPLYLSSLPAVLTLSEPAQRHFQGSSAV